MRISISSIIYTGGESTVQAADVTVHESLLPSRSKHSKVEVCVRECDLQDGLIGKFLSLQTKNVYSVTFFLLVQIKTHIEFEYPLISWKPHWEFDPNHQRRLFVSKNQPS